MLVITHLFSLIFFLSTACKYLGCKTKVECKKGFRITKKTCWKLLACSCHPITTITYTPVICPPKRCVKKCNPTGCGGTVRCTENRPVNCQCVRRLNITKILCCCKKTVRDVVCKNPYIIEILIGYLLNAKQDKCKRYVTRKRIAVKSECSFEKIFFFNFVVFSWRCIFSIHKRVTKEQFSGFSL